MTNTIPNVPRDLLADLLGNDHDKRIMAERHLLAMLANTPSPAGVDGLEVARKACEAANCKYPEMDAMADFKRDVTPSFVIGLLDGIRHAKGIAAINDARANGCAETVQFLRLELSAAQALIDGLRGEVGAQRVKTCAALKARNDAHEERDQQAQRIGELEGLLLDARLMTFVVNSGHSVVLRPRIDAALAEIDNGN